MPARVLLCTVSASRQVVNVSRVGYATQPPLYLPLLNVARLHCFLPKWLLARDHTASGRCACDRITAGVDGAIMTSERAIPHLRDIFGLNQQYETKQYDENEDKTKKSMRKKKDDYRSYGNGDVKTLERHLSMKKTIRKKIMRDLQQAFVEDPNEFKVENTSPEKLKAELSAEAVKIEKNVRKNDPTFLDMLRGETRVEEAREEQPQVEKTSFWRRLTMKNKNKR
ncbi:hypothetical protein KGM_210047 [Danaus plexippus plexippus]|uniref:Uncharacterized protein n=1 Tax=Danaus plexippus plexippus TaxID=278856 RepID=A0A212FCU7_DANPL|nr:hypothetical protein KGM_210047 [Danaus plexippus plexippus]